MAHDRGRALSGGLRAASRRLVTKRSIATIGYESTTVSAFL